MTANQDSQTTTTMNQVFIIEAESAISGNCLLGEGNTEAEAWEEAFGPKPWTPYVTRTAKKAWCREVSFAQAEEIRLSRFL